jgi:hypothetical protein
MSSCLCFVGVTWRDVDVGHLVNLPQAFTSPRLFLDY